MIEFDKNKKIFNISNGSISYFIYVNSEGILENLYFGKFTDKINLEKRIKKQDNYSTQYYDKKENVEKMFADKFSVKHSLFEIGFHNGGDNRPAPIIVQKNNGMYDTNFKYISHKIYQGLPIFKSDEPHLTGGNAETLEITLKDEFSDVVLIYNLSIMLDKDIIVKNFILKNDGSNNINILRAFSGQLDLNSRKYKVHHFYGNWGNERNEEVNNVLVGEQVISSNYGRSSHEHNPFIFLTKNGANFTIGEVIGFNLVYSGNFKYSIFSDYTNTTRISWGINDYDFNWILEPENIFVTPQAVISYSKNGIDEMSHNFHSLIKENLIQYKKEADYKSILFNSWEGCTFNFSTKSIKDYATAAKEIGAELFVVDDGWFGHRNDDHSSLGDWFVNENKVNLKEVEIHVHSLGMKFGLWFEPEMISFDSDLFKKHPEYAVGLYREHPILQRSQLMLDLTNDEVIDNICCQMVRILDSIKIDYIKWDMNRDIKEHFIERLGKNHQGEMLHKYVLGYYKLIGKICKKYPDIMIEGCASGGGRFDLGTLYYCPQIWASDISKPSTRMFINFNTSLGYPLSTVGTHINNSEETSYEEKGMLSLFGTFGYEMNPLKLTEIDKKEINNIAEFYRKNHKDLFENGTLYHLVSPTKNNYMVMQVVNKTKDHSCLIVVKKEGTINKTLKLRGLDFKSTYKNDHTKYNGQDLMENGFEFKMNKPGVEIKLFDFKK